MKTRKIQRSRRGSRRTEQSLQRRGSALLVVMVLMAMLAGLGVIFYVFSAQEQQSAVNYAEGAKSRETDLSADTLVDFGLEQLIVGPEVKYKNSALYGRRHTLMGNMLGVDSSGTRFDFAPYNGRVIPSANPSSVTYDTWAINDSPAANGGLDPNAQALAHRDPDYTYPDNNNVFVSFDGYDASGSFRVIIPSFHRPQYVRNYFAGSWYDATAASSSKMTTLGGSQLQPGSRQYVLRPHPDHDYVPPPGQRLNTTVKRFLTDAQAQSAWGPQSMGFPFVPPRDPALGNYATRTGSGPALGQQGVWSYTTGPPTAGDTIAYEYDVDNDGDGIWEGVWLDLGFPPLEDPTGKLFVPMFSFTVKDADALLNLNVHGNLAAVWAGDVGLSSPFWTGSTTDSRYNPHVSRSNLGLTPGEVNPLWGLNRRPETDALQSAGLTYHDGAYPNDPMFSNRPLAWHESANRELHFLLQGRYTSSPSNLIPGRWGEEHLLFNALSNSSPRLSLYHAFDSGSGSQLAHPWPGPGQTLIDDNGDTQQLTGGWYGGTYAAFGHPLDYMGLGAYYVTDPAQSGVGKSLRDAGSGRLYWPQYSRYGNNSTNPVGWTSVVGSVSAGLFNDSAEVVIDGDDLRPEDDVFGADEMRALHMSSADFLTAAGGSSRLTELAPFNFDATNSAFGSGSSARSTQAFRGKFTTRSWDRKQSTVTYNSDDTSNLWMFSADADRDGKLEFPPEFGSGTLYSTSTDLFRPLVRRLLQVEAENFDELQYGSRLSINQLLVGPNGNPFPLFSQNSGLPPELELHYRPLTPHPDPTLLGATVVNNYGLNSYPANGNFAGLPQQEYWARIDRQLLAQDIFALLYTLGWPNGVDPSATSTAASRSGYADTVRQMAQFAVNLVDSLDRDNIMTRFEYDTNPTDGWQVDGNPYTTTDTDRGEVWGIEALDLTLSEALLVNAAEESGGNNFQYTEWDDTQDTYFSYVELRNAGPNDVNLANRAWRVDVGPDYLDYNNTDLAQFRRATLKSGTIVSGQTYTIGSTNATIGGSHPSIMKISTNGSMPADWDGDPVLWIAPNQRELDLDLKDPAHVSRFDLLDAAGNTVPSGAFFDQARVNGLVRLFRRANPTRPYPNTGAEEADNPYVLVDEIYLDNLTQETSSNRGGTLDFAMADTQTEIENKLRNLRSREHAEPFGGDRTDGNAYHDAEIYANSLGTDNTNSPSQFSRWQQVFDRDYASVGELLGLPLGGAVELEAMRTANVSAMMNNRTRGPLATLVTRIDGTDDWRAFLDQTSEATLPGTAEQMFLPFTAKLGLGNSMTTNMPNWHRLLGLVEVPTRVHSGVPGFTDPIDYARVPGRVNVNMMRHPEALAALIDDPTIMRLVVDEDVNFNATLDSGEEVISPDGPNRIDAFNPPLLPRLDDVTSTVSWWNGFAAARDGYRDTTAAANTPQADSFTNLYLPGWADENQSATPIRSFAAVSGTFATEQTLLRSWPVDETPTTTSSTENPRQLFEVGTQLEHLGTEDTNGNGVLDSGEDLNSNGMLDTTAQLDPYVRRRVLNKILNNTTTRSNVFVVFMSVKYFRALDENGGIRIGGPLKDFDDVSSLPLSPPERTDNGWQPEHRAFLVIDRSRLEKAYDQSTGKIDFRSLVEFRQILQ